MKISDMQYIITEIYNDGHSAILSRINPQNLMDSSRNSTLLHTSFHETRLKTFVLNLFRGETDMQTNK